MKESERKTKITLIVKLINNPTVDFQKVSSSYDADKNIFGEQQADKLLDMRLNDLIRFSHDGRA